jgi:intron-binding protein aquarius
MQNPAFLAANPGFGYDFQMINVPDYNGKGESEPAPYYFQNLGEAEYIVAVYRWALSSFKCFYCCCFCVNIVMWH